ncbi:hypothetical protein HDU91_000837 [Kappamyces sp. JEL0680]|nr:hypothetical protein HDU91_000837 [Kappamyces sp. JEL0680]
MLGDIVLSDLSRARNYLVPFQFAYYLPRFKGKAILPDGWTPPVKEEAGERVFITPAVPTVPYFESPTGAASFHPQPSALTFDQDGNPVPDQTQNASVPLSLSDSDLQKYLASLVQSNLGKPVVTFSRVKISSASEKIFGSVNPNEIAEAFLDRYNLVLPKEYITGRLKEIGSHELQIVFSDPSVEPLTIPVQVVDV